MNNDDSQKEIIEKIYNQNFTDCLKCKMWNLVAIENNYRRGMCEECFKNQFSHFIPIADVSQMKDYEYEK